MQLFQKSSKRKSKCWKEKHVHTQFVKLSYKTSVFICHYSFTSIIYIVWLNCQVSEKPIVFYDFVGYNMWMWLGDDWVILRLWGWFRLVIALGISNFSIFGAKTINKLPFLSLEEVLWSEARWPKLIKQQENMNR